MTEAEQRFHEYFMRIALREAQCSIDAGEVPCGCVIVQVPEDVFKPGIAKPRPLDDPLTAKVIASAHNQTEALNDPTAHAEILAITSATATINDWRLKDSIVYVTKEPCPMCAGALIWARPQMIVWGLSDDMRGGENEFGILSSTKVNHHPRIIQGILAETCRMQFVDFFKNKRKDFKS